ncbi:hypothetical protein Y032_0012g1823 [Ancylostoma ceylanicum]|uniref:Uncharacterized protein n=1 Tax=Ancylostoma ceylanicum TaxID=53326 RepID=A0A016VCD0_9BILA|nr:hypothetical protein Y032_0012g1823 [Ancylostoma ceylanicum]
MMTTPLAAPNIQERRNPKKRPCTEVNDLSPQHSDLDQQASMLLDDDTFPVHVRSVISLLMEDRKRLSSMLEKYRDLHDEVMFLKSEYASLRSTSLSQNNQVVTSHVNSVPESMSSPEPDAPSNEKNVRSYDEVERSRSIIVAGLPESSAEQASLKTALTLKNVHYLFMEFCSGAYYCAHGREETSKKDQVSE